MNNIAVSVLCAAYNQEKYIRKMLNGLIMQETTFPVEFLVHDDASTDQTAAIIQEYADKYPDRIIPFFETENQYSKGVNFLSSQLLPAARGKYIAFCEGDDFWTDSEKLQRQFEIMEAHPECSICVHEVQGISEDEYHIIRNFPDFPIQEGLIDSHELIHRMLVDKKWVFHTTSYFMKTEMIRQAIQNRLTFFTNAMYPDHGMLLLSVYSGLFYYLHRNMSTYRMQANGGITNTSIGREEDILRRKSSAFIPVN